MPVSENFSERRWQPSGWTLPAAALVTVLEAALFLFGMQRGSKPPQPEPIVVHLVELPAATPEPAAEPSPEAAPESPPLLVEPEPAPPPAVVKPEPATTPIAPQIAQPLPEPREPPPSPRPAAKAAPRPHRAMASPAPSSPVAPPSVIAPEAKSTLPGGGTMSARAIEKPMPEIPEALRHRSLDLVAVARFRVAADGHAEIELIEATPDPNLNRVLLEALRKWRFFPALADGKPVASTIELRIPIAVQ